MGGNRYAEHARASEALLSEYRRLPPDAPVRLAKKTSNLFRFSRSRAPVGLDVHRLDAVIAIDPNERTADVQGMCTYERLVDATLPYGLMPLVVPQLKTITLGGAVAGLGIESTSFRDGLPHESVLEMEILTGDGSLVLVRPDNAHADLYRTFPNSYGTLGYATRLKIELAPVKPFVRLRHLAFDDASACFAALEQLCDTGGGDFIDGTVFSRDEMYLTVAEFVDDPDSPPSDYTGMQIYYRSIQQRTEDVLTTRDYLWRWDTDWFWCSRALGVQQPAIRRLWPRRYRRSDVYRRLVALDRRYRISGRVDRWRGRPRQEPVVQDVEVPIAAAPKFLDFMHAEIGITPIWLCPLRLRSPKPWPLYPLRPQQLYVNFGFWSSVALRPGQPDGYHNRLIEDTVTELGGHKSLYSTVHYPPEEFWRLYHADAYRAVKHQYDPASRLPDLYDKCVGTW